MSKRKGNGNDKGRIGGPFVPLLKDTLASPAWRAMSHGARSLYAALRSHVSNDMRNNGRVFLSVRDACKEIGSSHEQVVRWFHELQHFGFTVMTSAGCLGPDGVGKAPHWRLTELGSYESGSLALPTREFLRWTGERFVYSPTKKQNPVAESRNTPLRKAATPPLRKAATPNGQSVAESRNISTAPGVAESRNISSLTTGVVISGDPAQGIGASSATTTTPHDDLPGASREASRALANGPEKNGAEYKPAPRTRAKGALAPDTSRTPSDMKGTS